ncbi:MAG: hypothetical protein ACYST2_06465, partial [Planctomycetota bacterium]
MAEKDPGLHKDIASIFQDLSAQEKKQQNSSENDESEQQNDIFSELLTPSHLVSEPDSSQKLKEQTEKQIEQTVEDIDAVHQEKQTSEDGTTETLSDEETEIVSETTIHQQQVDNNEATAPEIVQPKIIVPGSAKQLTGIRKIVQTIQEKLLAPKPGVDPRRQKMTIFLIPVLFVILIVVFTQVFKSPAKNINAAASTEAPAVVQISKEIKWQMPELYPENLRDPMKRGSVTTARVVYNDIMVKGILYSQDNPAALIA